MAIQRVPAIRLVRCPKCFNVLPEPSESVVYECGICFTLLQANQSKMKTLFSSDSCGSSPTTPKKEAKLNFFNSDEETEHENGKNLVTDVWSISGRESWKSAKSWNSKPARQQDRTHQYMLGSPFNQFHKPRKGLENSTETLTLNVYMKICEIQELLKATLLNEIGSSSEWGSTSADWRSPDTQNYYYKDKHMFSPTKAAPARKYVKPLSGAAPFVVCTACLNPLLLPADLGLFGRRCCKVACGGCGEVVKFTPADPKPSVPYTIDEPEKMAYEEREAIRLHELMGYSSVSRIVGRRGEKYQ